jgi:hypothetical protein
MNIELVIGIGFVILALFTILSLFYTKFDITYKIYNIMLIPIWLIIILEVALLLTLAFIRLY